jgi:integral membrane protein
VGASRPASAVILYRVNTLTTFRIVAIAEATSFLMLLVASVLKRTADAEIGVTVLGPIHGGLFLAYVFLALYLRPDQGWSGRTTALILLGAVVPFGGYVVDRWLTPSSRSPAVPSEGS